VTSLRWCKSSALIEAELSAVISASPRQRTETRSGLRNGYWPRTITTIAGDLELKIPRLRQGRSSRRCWSGGGRRVDQSLFAVIMEAYLHGTSPARSMTWSRRCGSPSPRCPGSAPTSTPKSPRMNNLPMLRTWHGQPGETSPVSRTALNRPDAHAGSTNLKLACLV
jgi:hypothetical protein